MNTHIQELPEKPRTPRHTGFPEPLSIGMLSDPSFCFNTDLVDRNTTLPHPDADTSPGATIESADIDLVRTRSRISFRGRHRSGKNNKGAIVVPEDLHTNIHYADGSKETNDFATIEKEAGAREDILEPPVVKEEVGESEKGEQKKGILGKLSSLKV